MDFSTLVTWVTMTAKEWYFSLNVLPIWFSFGCMKWLHLFWNPGKNLWIRGLLQWLCLPSKIITVLAQLKSTIDCKPFHTLYKSKFKSNYNQSLWNNSFPEMWVEKIQTMSYIGRSTVYPAMFSYHHLLSNNQKCRNSASPANSAQHSAKNA